MAAEMFGQLLFWHTCDEGCLQRWLPASAVVKTMIIILVCVSRTLFCQSRLWRQINTINHINLVQQNFLYTTMGVFSCVSSLKTLNFQGNFQVVSNLRAMHPTHLTQNLLSSFLNLFSLPTQTFLELLLLLFIFLMSITITIYNFFSWCIWM